MRTLALPSLAALSLVATFPTQASPEEAMAPRMDTCIQNEVGPRMVTFQCRMGVSDFVATLATYVREHPRLRVAAMTPLEGYCTTSCTFYRFLVVFEIS